MWNQNIHISSLKDLFKGWSRTYLFNIPWLKIENNLKITASKYTVKHPSLCIWNIKTIHKKIATELVNNVNLWFTLTSQRPYFVLLPRTLCRFASSSKGGWLWFLPFTYTFRFNLFQHTLNLALLLVEMLVHAIDKHIQWKWPLSP